MLKTGFNWLLTKLGELLNNIVSVLGDATNDLTPVFILVAMIGMILTMIGNKRLGTKLSSISFFSYIVFKAVFKC